MRTFGMQAAVDGIAARLGRPAVVEDYFHRVLVYSEHESLVDTDEVRQLSILRRRTTTDVVSWLRRQGIVQATGPIRVPACPKLHMLPRVCVPVRHRDLLLGYLWFIDAIRPMSTVQLKVADEAGQELAPLLLRDVRAGEVEQQRTVAAMGALLGSDPAAREAAAQVLSDDGSPFAGGVVAVVIQAASAQRAVLEEVAAAALHLVRQDHLVVLAPAGPSVMDYALRLQQAAARTINSVVAGVGAPSSLVDAHESYQQARLAARVALAQSDAVLAWEALGVYRILGASPRPADIHAGLAAMMLDPACEPLLETLEAYLDLAGNAEATARQLHLHRTSLYYRLQRIEALAGTNLKDGGERLCLHLALKAARLAP